MPSLSISWDIRDLLLQAADRMAVQKHLPEFIAKTVDQKGWLKKKK